MTYLKFQDDLPKSDPLYKAKLFAGAFLNYLGISVTAGYERIIECKDLKVLMQILSEHGPDYYQAQIVMSPWVQHSRTEQDWRNAGALPIYMEGLTAYMYWKEDEHDFFFPKNPLLDHLTLDMLLERTSKGEASWKDLFEVGRNLGLSHASFRIKIAEALKRMPFECVPFLLTPLSNTDELVTLLVGELPTDEPVPQETKI